MDNPKDFEEDENKLSKEELDALLKEVENDSRQVVRREQPVKKKNIRFDMIIAAVIAFVIVVGGVLLVRHFVVNTPSKAEKAVAENPLQDDKYPEITDVVKNYLNAFLIEDDAKRAEKTYFLRTAKSMALLRHDRRQSPLRKQPGVGRRDGTRPDRRAVTVCV